MASPSFDSISAYNLNKRNCNWFILLYNTKLNQYCCKSLCLWYTVLITLLKLTFSSTYLPWTKTIQHPCVNGKLCLNGRHACDSFVMAAGACGIITLMHIDVRVPSKRGIFAQCCFNVGPATKTVGQHWNNIGWMIRACWVGNLWGCYIAK